ncbi:STN domain-containing protein [Pseudomonas citronellolis]|uniref:STN domain-containing protein n=1 Tax=Pseudomonas citronellolis TaxID=53408 RepID=UPI001428CD70|nr:STN domain-containing protein [Pseudomonas humi]
MNRKPLHSKRSPLARLVGAAALGLSLSATSVFAAPVRIDIPAQPLASALTNLGSQAHLQIIFNQAQVQNLRSPGVHGEMEPARALEQLLRGTGIRYQVDGSRVTLLGADAAGNDTLAMPAQVVRRSGRHRQLRTAYQHQREQDRYPIAGDPAVGLGDHPQADGRPGRAERQPGAALRARRARGDLRPGPQGL